MPKVTTWARKVLYIYSGLGAVTVLCHQDVGPSEFEKRGTASGMVGSWVFQQPAANGQRDTGANLRNWRSREQLFAGRI